MVTKLSIFFLTHHPQDSARILEDFNTDEVKEYLSAVSSKVAASIIQHMTPTFAVKCLMSLEPKCSAEILEKLGVELAAGYLRRLKTGIQKNILAESSTIFSNIMRLVLIYPEGTAGRIMSPDVFAVPGDLTVNEVLKKLHDHFGEIQNEIYIIDEKQRLIGVADIADLLRSEPDQLINTIKHRPEKTVSIRSDVNYVQKLKEWQYKEILPVIDHSGALAGVIRRSVINDFINKGHNFDEETEIAETAIELVQLFCDTCMELMAPLTNIQEKEQKNE